MTTRRSGGLTPPTCTRCCCWVPKAPKSQLECVRIDVRVLLHETIGYCSQYFQHFAASTELFTRHCIPRYWSVLVSYTQRRHRACLALCRPSTRWVMVRLTARLLLESTTNMHLDGVTRLLRTCLGRVKCVFCVDGF